MVEEFLIGDPVWAKMKGYPPWPARIDSPPPDAKPQKNKHFVYFFGSNNVAWIPDENISHHNEQQFLNSSTKKKTATLQNAIDALVTYSKSYKRKKPNTPPRVESEKSKEKKPRSKIVKVTNSASKKHERNVFSIKSHIKGKKRSLGDLNGSGRYMSSKSPKFKSKKSSFSGVPRRMSLYSSFFSDDSSMDRLPLNSKHIQPSPLRFGFIGMGAMGRNMVRTLLQFGHDVSVWNRTSQQCDLLLIFGATRARSPAELIVNCDVTFCCVSDPEATKAVIFGEQGVLMGLVEAGKLNKGRRGFVNMTNTDPNSSTKISEAILKNCGFYLEAPVWGSSKDASTGQLLVLAAGDRILFAECETCFQSIAKNAYYLSCDAGEGNKMILIMNTMFGTMCAALAEAMVTIERLKLQKEDFFHTLVHSISHFPALFEKAKMMANLSFKSVTALKHMQKNLDLALLMADSYSQPMPVTVAANETYKCAKMRKISEEDISAVYKVVRF